LVKSKDLVKDKIAEKIGFPLSLAPKESKGTVTKNISSNIDKTNIPNNISRHPQEKEAKTPQIQKQRGIYEISDKILQEIIRLHFFELTAEKISEHLDIQLDIINSVLEDFSNGNLSFENSKSPEISNKKQIDINSFKLKENPFPQNGSIVEIEKLPVICEKCKNPLLKLVYENGKTIFFCRYCFK
jgi:hypothetical protein